MDKEKLECWSFWWSEIRLIIAAIALFLGGVPPVLKLLPGMPLVGAVLTICWIVSGVASLYLLYLWWGHWRVFGGKDTADVVAFLIMCVSGLNLGFAGIFGRNIGMQINSSYAVFVLVALVYLVTAFYLNQRWRSNGKRVFGNH